MLVMTYLLRLDIGRGWMVLLTFISHTACGFLTDGKWLRSVQTPQALSRSFWDHVAQSRRHSGHPAMTQDENGASTVGILNARHRSLFLTDEMFAVSIDRHGVTLKNKDFINLGSRPRKVVDSSPGEFRGHKINSHSAKNKLASYSPSGDHTVLEKPTRSSVFSKTKFAEKGLSSFSIDDLRYIFNSRNGLSNLLLPFLFSESYSSAKRRQVVVNENLDKTLPQPEHRVSSERSPLTRTGVHSRQKQQQQLPTSQIHGDRHPHVDRTRNDHSNVDYVPVDSELVVGKTVPTTSTNFRQGHAPKSASAPHTSNIFERIQRLVNDSDADYQDHPIPSSSLVNMTVHPFPQTTRVSAAFKRTVPTAGPHKLPLLPTLVPLRKSSPAARPQPVGSHKFFPSLSKLFVDPTLANQTLHSAINLSSTDLLASKASFLGDSPKEREVLKDKGSLGAGPESTEPSGTYSFSVVLGGPGSSSVACLQFVRVEHDVPCGSRQRRDVLTTQHLSLLLKQHGGSASSPFTAPTLHQASSSFRNLMPLGIPDMDDHIHLKYTTDQIQRQLENHHLAQAQTQTRHSAILKPASRTNQPSLGQNLLKNTSRKDTLVKKEHADGVDQQVSDSPSLPYVFLQQMVPAQMLTPHGKTARRTKRAFEGNDRRSFACSYSVDCAHFDASGCPDNQTEMVLDDNNCHTCQCRAQETISGYCQRAASSTSSSSSSSSVQSSYVHLCTQCQRTRHLGDDIFPSYVQEVVCHPADGPCLNIAGVAHGRCRESYVPVTFLRRVPDRCMSVELPSGQRLLTDDWQVFQGIVRTGCQCMVDKRSPLAASMLHES